MPPDPSRPIADVRTALDAGTGFACCPACNVGWIPVLPDRSLAAHQWLSGRYVDGSDGPDDADGNPTPGEWVGGCRSRTLGASHAALSPTR